MEEDESPTFVLSQVVEMSEHAAAYDFFISYNRRDWALVEVLATRLGAEAGLRVWLDRDQLQPGVSWRQEIETAMNGSAATLIVWGPHGLGPIQRRERDLAYAIHDDREDFRVLYVLLPYTPPPKGTWANVDTWVQFETSLDEPDTFDQLVASLKGQAPPNALAAELPDYPVPYRGLAAFGLEDARFFFGRTAYVEQMQERLLYHPFLAILGPSGSGKTSLVQAGFLARLKSGAASGTTWSQLLVRPGSSPLRSLATELARLQVPTDPLAAADGILERLQTTSESLATIIAALLPRDGRLVVVVDRLEEVFILCEGEQERRAFLDTILSLVEHPHRPAWVVATMRADFYGHVGRYARLASEVVNHQVYVKPMSDEEVAEVIEAPAAQVGAIFEKRDCQ